MTVGIILAAGESKRMGTAKQLLPWGKTIVLQRVIDMAAGSCLERVILVLGYRADEIANRIRLPDKARIVVNETYREGMASSLKCGIRNAPAATEAFMLILGDQPFIEVTVFNHLIAAHHAGSGGITIPTYDGKRGHPVVFSSRYREELLAVSDQGAREVLSRHIDAIIELTMPSPYILSDLDTPEDYQKSKAQMERGKR